MKRANTKLYKDLMNLCNDVDGKAKFFYKDDITGMGTKVRIFSYHIANYSDWIKPNALECRGIMFEMNEQDKPVRVMARPMEKFFNLGENPLTIGIDMTTALYYMTKEDGSLISSFADKGILGFKSKTSIYSDQVAWAAMWMNDHPALKHRVVELGQAGYTVNFEYVGPKNRIVLGYAEAALRILNVRDNETGDYIEFNELFADAILRPYLVDVFDSSDCSDEWVEKVRKMEGIEGYIVVFNGKVVKLKTDWYVALHHTKDSINNNKRLVECCIENVTDDLRGLFVGDQMALDKIYAFEMKYHETLGEWFKFVVEFIEDSRHLDRKDFAIKATIACKNYRPIFGVIMNCYLSWSQERIIEDLNNVMRKNTDLLIPTEYQ